MAGRAPQNGRYFQFLRLFSRPRDPLLPARPTSRRCHLTVRARFPLFPCRTASAYSVPFGLRLTYYRKAIVFSRRRFSYCAAIFHRAIPRHRAGNGAGELPPAGEDTDAFNMQSPKGGWPGEETTGEARAPPLDGLSCDSQRLARPAARHLAPPSRTGRPSINFPRSFLRSGSVADVPKLPAAPLRRPPSVCTRAAGDCAPHPPEVLEISA